MPCSIYHLPFFLILIRTIGANFISFTSPLTKTPSNCGGCNSSIENLTNGYLISIVGINWLIGDALVYGSATDYYVRIVQGSDFGFGIMALTSIDCTAPPPDNPTSTVYDSTSILCPSWGPPWGLYDSSSYQAALTGTLQFNQLYHVSFDGNQTGPNLNVSTYLSGCSSSINDSHGQVNYKWAPYFEVLNQSTPVIFDVRSSPCLIPADFSSCNVGCTMPGHCACINPDCSCQTCSDGFQNTTSTKCCLISGNCANCDISGVCTSCNPTTWLSSGSCVIQCPNGYYANNSTGTCSPCLSPCLDCSSTTNCSSCTTGFYFNGTCLSCSNTCETCSGPNLNNCMTCDNSHQLANGFCCDLSCHTCSSNTNTSCKSCKNGFYLTENNSCAACNPKCLTCNGPDFGNCTSCSNELNLTNGYCCQGTCATCSSENATYCMACVNGYVLNSNSNTCTPASSGCPHGYFLDLILNTCHEICGDGIKFSPNPWCDDGNGVSGDGCSSACNVEGGFTCEGGSPTSKDKCFAIFPPSAMITFPSSATNAIITFSQAIANLEGLDLNSIQLSIKGDVGQYNYSISLNQRSILIDFQFTTSFKKSILSVSFQNPSSISTIYNLSLKNPQLSAWMPRFQFLSSAAQGAMSFADFGSSLSGITLSYASIPLIMLSIGMNTLWSLITDLEVMYLLSLLNVNYPSNVLRIQENLSMAPFSQLPNYLGYYAESHNYLQEWQYFQNSQDFFTSFLVNSGRMVIYFVIMLIFKVLIVLFGDSCKNDIVKNIFLWIDYKIISQTILTVIQISFYQLIISGAIQLYEINYSSYFNTFSSVIGYATLLYMIIWIQYNYYLSKYARRLATYQAELKTRRQSKRESKRQSKRPNGRQKGRISEPITEQQNGLKTEQQTQGKTERRTERETDRKSERKSKLPRFELRTEQQNGSKTERQIEVKTERRTGQKSKRITDQKSERKMEGKTERHSIRRKIQNFFESQVPSTIPFFQIAMVDKEAPHAELKYSVLEVIQKFWFGIVLIVLLNHPIFQLALMATPNVYLLTQMSKYHQIEDKRFKILNLSMTLTIILIVSVFAIDDIFDIMTEAQQLDVGWLVVTISIIYTIILTVKFGIESYKQVKKLILYACKVARSLKWIK